MKLDLGPHKQGYVAPAFGGDDKLPMDPALEARMRRPIMVGVWIIVLFVFGLGLWAAVTPLSSGVTALGQVRVDSNKKTLRAREGGVVREILVNEGQYVRAGQPLILFNDIAARSAVEVFQNQYDTILAQSARFTAEATGRSSLKFPAELTDRISDPRVAGLIRDQQFLFSNRLQLLETQASVLSQRLEQAQSQIDGLQAQLDSVDEQRRLTEEELAGYKKLNEQGYAPKTLILRYERTLADLGGRRGQLVADIGRVKQQMGETRFQLSSVREQRQTEAAEGMRDSQAKLADVLPRLATAKQGLEGTVVKAPVNGYVFSLTQFTVGGVVGAGETLMDVVPAETPLTVTANIKPEDVDQVHVGMPARVRLSGLNRRFNDDLNATVAVVSADRLTNPQTGISVYRVDLHIPPKELTKLKKGVKLTPGMPAQVMFVTGSRTVMSFLISPITETLHDAFREE